MIKPSELAFLIIIVLTFLALVLVEQSKPEFDTIRINVYTCEDLLNDQEMREIAIDINCTTEDTGADSIVEANMNYSDPEYYPTLSMSELKYKGEEVIWVYQIDKIIDDYRYEIIPCIILKNEERYCAESAVKTGDSK